MSRVIKQKRMLVKRTVGAAKVQRTDERLMLGACSLTLALASRNEGVVQLAAEVERERVRVRVIGGLGCRCRTEIYGRMCQRNE